MLKHIVLATFITAGSMSAYAQSPQKAANPPAATMTTKTSGVAASADTSKLIGRNIQNTQNETIGEIKSIYIGKDGKVDSVMVSVGGFLGVGEREVQLRWSDLVIKNNGEQVMVEMTKDQLKAKPEYKYGNPAYRGQVFTDKGPWMADAAATTATKSTGDFNADSQMSGEALIGANVHNENRETVGEVEDVYIGKDGAIKAVVVSVGGFLGMGAKNVAVKWSDIEFTRDGDSLVLVTNWSKESLKKMPDYMYERRVPATRAGG